MSLEASKAMQELHNTFSERIKFLENWLGKGLAVDYSEYRAVCGEIKGLAGCCRYINESYIKAVEGDE